VKPGDFDSSVDSPDATYGGYPDLTRVRRILVIKLGHHGDVLLASPVFSALQAALPGAEIDAYISRESLAVLEGHPAIARFLLLDRAARRRGALARMAEEFRVFGALRAGRYDLVLSLSESDRGRIAARVSGAPLRVGFKLRGRSSPGYTHLVSRPSLARHVVERNLDALRRIGIFPDVSGRALNFPLPEADRESVRVRLAAEGIEQGGFVHVHPASRWLFKTWPAERVAEVVRRLGSSGMRCVLTAAPDPAEKAMVARIVALSGHARPVDLAGAVTLKQLGALIDSSAALLCVDSLPLHIASALKHPVVALFGPSSEKDWGPWQNPNARVLATDFPCRPCGLDGCGGSKVSDCLVELPGARVIAALEDVIGATALSRRTDPPRSQDPPR
jgi:heptosyltransferase-3